MPLPVGLLAGLRGIFTGLVILVSVLKTVLSGMADGLSIHIFPPVPAQLHRFVCILIIFAVTHISSPAYLMNDYKDCRQNSK